jgi:hypothetical protein
MNDARGYRVYAAECPFADKFCQPRYHPPLLSPLLMACACPADEAVGALLVAR